MFTTVKGLTALLDKNIGYYNDGIASREQHTETEFSTWYESITAKMRKQFTELKRISTNQKIIAKYEKALAGILE